MFTDGDTVIVGEVIGELIVSKNKLVVDHMYSADVPNEFAVIEIKFVSEHKVVSFGTASNGVFTFTI